jgi:hypothetical protein
MAPLISFKVTEKQRLFLKNLGLELGLRASPAAKTLMVVAARRAGDLLGDAGRIALAKTGSLDEEEEEQEGEEA